MKEKTIKKSSKTAFKKILNYLLFQDFNTPNFISGFVNLSESFIVSNKAATSTDEVLNSKLIDILKFSYLTWTMKIEEESLIPY